MRTGIIACFIAVAISIVAAPVLTAQQPPQKPEPWKSEDIIYAEAAQPQARISPDAKWLVFLSYEKDVKGHPENKDVTLRLLQWPEAKIEVLAKLFGGQGTIKVPSWSPDSRKLAFVSYQFTP